MLLLFELLHAAVVGVLVLLRVAVLRGLGAVRLVSDWITNDFVWVVVHHDGRRMVKMLLPHALVKLRRCLRSRLL